MPPQKRAIKNRMAGIFNYQQENRIKYTNKEKVNKTKKLQPGDRKVTEASVLGEIFTTTLDNHGNNDNKREISGSFTVDPQQQVAMDIDNNVNMMEEPPISIAIIPAETTKKTPVILGFVFQL